MWVVRRDRGLTAVEQDEFSQWLAADPRHRDSLERQQATANGLRRLGQLRPAGGAPPDPDLLGGSAPAQFPSRSILFALAAAVVVALAGWWVLAGRVPTRSAQPSIASLGSGQQVLDDGSILECDGPAQVDVRFTLPERRVRLLGGKVWFDVAKNPARPFIVQAGHVEVTAVGTAFEVALAPAQIAVVVTAGQVRVQSPASGGAPVLVAAGQQAIVVGETAEPQVTTLPPDELKRRTAWQVRTLEFTDAPLAQVVAELNRYSHTKLIVDDPALAQLKIGATLRSDNVDGFVDTLERAFHIIAERREDGLIVLRSAAAPVPAP